MDEFAPFLPVIVAGLASTVLPLILFTNRVLVSLAGISTHHKKDNGFRPFSPNWITVWGTLFMYVGAVIYAMGFWATGLALAGFGGILDRIDGRSASALNRSLPVKWKLWRVKYVHTNEGTTTHESKRDRGWFARTWFEMNFPGGTNLGKSLDPAMDKSKYLPILLGFTVAGLLWWPALAVLVVAEAVGTAMRHIPTLAKYQKESKASAIGKIKSILIWFVIIFCIPFHEGWPIFNLTPEGTQWWILNGMLMACVLLAWASVISRVWAPERSGVLSSTLKSLDDAFAHK